MNANDEHIGMNRRHMIGIVAIGILAGVSGCRALGHYRYRYRMTVEVETPQGLKTGSSVIAVDASTGVNPLGIFPYAESSAEVTGEAVAVDLAPGKTLFALLSSAAGDGEAAARYAFAGLPPLVRRSGEGAYAGNLAELIGRTEVGALPMPRPGDEVPVPGRQSKVFPLLVTFADTNDPKTVARVNPLDLATSFGPGVRLRRITVQITDDQVTTGIEKRLGWLPQVYNYLDRDFRPDGIPVGDFKRLFSTEVGH